MIAKAETKYLRMSPMKARQVIALIKNKPVNQALAILMTVNKKPTFYLKKILESALNNAKNKGFEASQLFVSNMIALNGPMWKRFRAGSFGRAQPILKHTTHVKIELDLMPEAVTKEAFKDKTSKSKKTAVK
jgi:large subunit ribosomal protein L22